MREEANERSILEVTTRDSNTCALRGLHTLRARGNNMRFELSPLKRRFIYIGLEVRIRLHGKGRFMTNSVLMELVNRAKV